jgi:hypothetical protein
MEEKGETTRLPAAEILNVAALVLVVVGVFLLPIAGP